MHEHPNDCHFTTPTLVMGQRLSVPAMKQLEFSSDEKNADVLASCVQAASLAVDEARAALSSALTGPDIGLIDPAAWAYKEAVRLFLAAQLEFRLEFRRGAAAADPKLVAAMDAWLSGFPAGDCSTPPTRSHTLSGDAEMRGDLR